MFASTSIKDVGFSDACYDDDINPKCQNGGICRSWYSASQVTPYYFTCFCLNGFSGTLCDIRKLFKIFVNPFATGLAKI